MSTTTATAVTDRPVVLTAPSNVVRDTAIVFGRELRPVLRDPFSVVFSMIQPLVFLGLFAPLLGNVPGLAGGALQWFVPGADHGLPLGWSRELNDAVLGFLSAIRR